MAIDTSQLGFGSVVAIEELTAAGAGWKPRVLYLRGPSLPLQGADWGTVNRIPTSFPAGGVDGTQHMLGPTEMPSNWNGVWSRTQLGRVPAIYDDETGTRNRIINPMTLREVLEAIVREGQRLRVTWSATGNTLAGDPRRGGIVAGEDRKIVREGRAQSFKTPVNDHTFIKWEIVFQWVGRGAAQQRAVSVRQDTDLASTANAVDASVQAMEFAVLSKVVQIDAARRLSSTGFTLGQLEQLAGAPLRLVNNALRSLRRAVAVFRQAGDVVRKLRAQPFAIANSVLALARNTRAVANQAADQLSRTPPEEMTTKSRVSDLLRAHRYFGNAQLAASGVARQGWILESRIRQVLVSGANRGALSVRDSSTTRAGDVLAVYVPKLGETPQSVSTKFYGSPDHGADVLRANRMPWYTPTFRPGVPIIVPALANAPRSA